MGVFMRHSDLPGAVIETTEISGDGGEAQAVHYESRGWQRIPASVVAAEAYTGRPVNALDELTVDELTDLATVHQLTVPAKAKKDEIVALLETHFDTSGDSIDQLQQTGEQTDQES